MDFKAYPILYVDDERANRVVMKHNLAQEFTLHIADGAAAALEILAVEKVAVLLTDQRMPRVTGVDLAEQTWRNHPAVIRVIITAYSDLEATIEAINRARVNRFIKKPWTREELVAVMRESIVAYHNGQLIEQLQQRLVQLDRLSSVAILGSSIAHDFRQPLAYVAPVLQLMAEDLAELRQQAIDPPSAAQAVERVHQGLLDLERGFERLSTMAHTLLTSLRQREPSPKAFDLRQIIQNATDLTRGAVGPKGMLRLRLPDEPVLVHASEGRLYQLIVNLVLNAIQSLDQRNKAANRIEVHLAQQAGQAAIAVTDTGCGIEPEQLSEIFKPLVTSKGDSGSGLGLAIGQQVVDELGGGIAVESEPGRGSRFSVTIPLHVPPKPPAPS
jgi:signal transduction histidine kinase